MVPWKISLSFALILISLTSSLAEDNETLALNFLNKYHYISQTRSGNHNVKTAIEHFQEYFHLTVNGKLDDETVGLMKKPRCGLPDEEDGMRKRFSPVSAWQKKSLTYYIDHGKDLSIATQDLVFSKALKFWSDVSQLNFEKVNTPGQADIKISFGENSHSGTSVEGTCPYPFDGEGGVLAHAYYPSDGRAHFDEAEQFTHESQIGTDLLWVATHEFGHSLGLDHTNIYGAIMYPYYTGYNPDMQLHADDIAGIQYLYGARSTVPTNAPPITTQPPTTAPSCEDRTDNCGLYENAGYCTKYPREMKYWCRKTCLLCA